MNQISPKDISLITADLKTTHFNWITSCPIPARFPANVENEPSTSASGDRLPVIELNVLRTSGDLFPANVENESRMSACLLGLSSAKLFITTFISLLPT